MASEREASCPRNWTSFRAGLRSALEPFRNQHRLVQAPDLPARITAVVHDIERAHRRLGSVGVAARTGLLWQACGCPEGGCNLTVHDPGEPTHPARSRCPEVHRCGRGRSLSNRTRAHLTVRPKRGRSDARQIFNCQRSRGGFTRTAPETARFRAVPATHSVNTSGSDKRPRGRLSALCVGRSKGFPALTGHRRRAE